VVWSGPLEARTKPPVETGPARGYSVSRRRGRCALRCVPFGPVRGHFVSRWKRRGAHFGGCRGRRPHRVRPFEQWGRALAAMLVHVDPSSDLLGGFLVKGSRRTTRAALRCRSRVRDVAAAATGQKPGATVAWVVRTRAVSRSCTHTLFVALPESGYVRRVPRRTPLRTVHPIRTQDIHGPGNGRRRPISEECTPRGSVISELPRWPGKPEYRRMSGGSNSSKAGSVHVGELGGGNIAGSWAPIGAGFRSCPVCSCEISVGSATRRRSGWSSRGFGEGGFRPARVGAMCRSALRRLIVGMLVRRDGGNIVQTPRPHLDVRHFCPHRFERDEGHFLSRFFSESFGGRRAAAWVDPRGAGTSCP
jgi:hypothetical protein